MTDDRDASEVHSKHRGKCICVAGEAVAQAMAAHPDDKGRFVHYIPKEGVPRIYAH